MIFLRNYIKIFVQKFSVSILLKKNKNEENEKERNKMNHYISLYIYKYLKISYYKSELYYSSEEETKKSYK